jgi:hypothetical protein
MKNVFSILSVTFILMLCLGACSTNSPGSVYSISGQIQKGPFVSGTTIKIQELNDQLSPNGTSYETVTNDDFGSFQIETNIKSKYVEIVATGYYFDEVAGTLSDGPLTLRAIADLSETKVVNINVLTTLEENRLKYLVGNGIAFAEAKQQAEQEILAIFNIPSSATSFSGMDLTQGREADGILLAVSAILQQGNSVAQLSELLSHLSLAVKTTGKLSDSSLISKLTQNSYDLDLVQIKNNLQRRYSSLGMNITIPPFESYSLLLNTTIPTVVSIYPGLDSTTSISRIRASATFSRKMDATKINESTFTLAYGGSSISSTVTYDPLTLTAYISPSSPIPDGTLVTATIASSVTDFAGNALASSFSWTFMVTYPSYMYIRWSPCMGAPVTYYSFADANAFACSGYITANADLGSLQEGESLQVGSSTLTRKNGIPCLTLFEGYSGSGDYVDAVVKVSLESAIISLQPYQIQASALKIFGWNGGSGQYMYSGFDIYNWQEQ